MFDPLVESVSLLWEPVAFVGNPHKRIFWLYLLSSGLIAWAVMLWRKVDLRAALKTLLNKKLWLNASSQVDVQWMFLNHLIRSLLVVPLLGGQIGFALWVNQCLFTSLGQGDFLVWSPLWVAASFTLCVFVVGDFSRFLVHYAYHKVPLLWRFHAVHHGATTLTPLTLYRIHPVEMLVNSCRSVLVVGCISGLFMYSFASAITVIDIMGVSIFSWLFNIAGANLRHSSIYLGYGRMEALFISPAQHQIHHSVAKEHIDKNFGSCLAVWDSLFNCWLASRKQQVPAYGLSGKSDEQSVARQWSGVS